MKTTITTTTLLLAVALAGGCKKKHDTKVEGPHVDDNGGGNASAGDGDDQDGDGSTATVTTTDDDGTTKSFRAIYFEFDSTDLTQDSRDELADLGDWMTKHGKAHVTIEGHCDDRGTDEYNLGLGDRRAHVIAEYLERLGVEDARLETISYGEEKPAVSGQSEGAWSKNRRGELKPTR